MIFKTVVLIACIIGSVHMEITPTVIQNIFDARINALVPIAQSITIVNGPLIVVGLGPFPACIAGIEDIVGILASHPTTEPGLNNPKKVCDLTTILIGKSGLFNTVPFIGQPLASVLRSLEAAVDAKTLQEEGRIATSQPDEAEKLRENHKVAVDSMTLAIQSYDGLAL